MWADPDRLLRAELYGPLAGMMLPKTDRVTMSQGLETRVPMLDHRMIRFARGLPWTRKVHKGQSKYALRMALAHELPAQIWQRPKRGFRVPLDQWLRTELNGWIRRQMQSMEALQVILGDISPASLLEEHASGRVQNGVQLWALAVLHPWVHMMDGRVAD